MSARLFRSFRPSRAEVERDVAQRFAAMTAEEFAAFLQTIPPQHWAAARALRESPPETTH